MTRGMKRRAAGDHRPGPERVLGDRAELDPGLVGREGDVDDDREVGLERERARREPANVVSSWATASAITSPGAPPASATSRAASAATKHPIRLSSARETSRSPGSSTGSDVDHADVADPDELARLVAVLGADVDVQVLDLGDLLALVALEQVDRLAADHAEDGPSRVAIRTRWPTSTIGSQPPTSPKRR